MHWPSGRQSFIHVLVGAALLAAFAPRALASDTTPPDTRITSGPSGTVSSRSATFTFSSTEAGSTFKCRLDGSAFRRCTSPKTYTGLAEGPHTFKVRAIDAAGNPDPTAAKRSWKIDSTRAVLVGAGDIASCSSSGDQATADLLDGIAGTVFTTGDNVYPDGTAAEFTNCYDLSWGRHKGRTRPAAGNHDYHVPGAAGYFGYFGTAAGDPAKGYYSYELGSWHVIVLNSNCEETGGCGAGSAQERWLREDLSNSDAVCTVAYWHHPRFSSGSDHGSNSTYQAFWQALYDLGADVVLAGHDHLYERFAPQTPTGAADATFGIRQFTVGTGGKSHATFASPMPNSQVRNGTTFGVLKLTLRATGYDWTFVPEAGKTFTDSGTGSCHGRR